MAYRVLITDDSPAMRTFVRRVIEVSGFELSACFEAGDGAEALAVLNNEWVDAILTDINMPGVDGEELLRRLASDESLRGIPAIVISTDATENRIARLTNGPGRERIRHQAFPPGNATRGTGAHFGGTL